MPVSKHENRVAMSVSGTPGTGTVTLGSAVTGARSFAAAYGANAIVDVLFKDGNDFEIARHCTYTHSGTTLTRGTRETSSTGAALSLTSAATAEVIFPASKGNALETMMQTHISGLVVTKGTGDTIDVTAGTWYDPETGLVAQYAGSTGNSPGTVTNNAWHQVYIYLNGGVPTLQIAGNSDAPSTPYLGTARKGGTGGERRWIGCFAGGSFGAVRDIRASEVPGGGYETYLFNTNPGAPPFRVLDNGTATSFTAVSLNTPVPKHVVTQVNFGAYIFSTSSGGTNSLYLSSDGIYENIGMIAIPPAAAGNYLSTLFTSHIDRVNNRIMYKVFNSTGGAYLDVVGFKVAR